MCARTISCAPACASEHTCAQACVAAYTHVCIMCTCARASCAHSYPSEHMCAHACVPGCIHVRTCGFMFTCMCYRAHVRARAFSCTHMHACASDHMCVQACVTACTHVCIMCTCVCFRAPVRASMCNVIHLCARAISCADACATEDMCDHAQSHVRTCLLPITCACKHVRVSCGEQPCTAGRPARPNAWYNLY